MLLALLTAMLLFGGCQNEAAKCRKVCTTLAQVCAVAATERPFVPAGETVEATRVCMESYALCRRGCEVQP